MNILYIEHYAGSPEMGMEFRPYYLAREWVRMGHKVRIIAGDYSHLRIRNPEVEEDFQEEVIDGISYHWVKTGTYQGNGVARALTMFRFVHKIRARARWIARAWKPDVIITSSTYPLDTYAGQKIKKWAKRIKSPNKTEPVLIHEVHDMWPITLYEIGGMKKTNPFVILMQMGENSFCKHSDYVVSLLCAAKDCFIEHGMAPEKFVPIMNGIVLSEWDNPTPLPEEHQALFDKLHSQGKFIICFFGSINVSYAIDYLIKAEQKVADDRIAIVIVGEGNQKEELQQMADDQVYFLPRIPKTAIPTLMEQIDSCYVGALHNDMFRFGICMNKLFDSMMSGKPILYAVDAPNNFITDYGCGISVKAEDTDALAEGMKELLELTPQEREEMGQHGRDAVLRYYNYEQLAAQFAQLFPCRTKKKQGVKGNK